MAPPWRSAVEMSGERRPSHLPCRRSLWYPWYLQSPQSYLQFLQWYCSSCRARCSGRRCRRSGGGARRRRRETAGDGNLLIATRRRRRALRGGRSLRHRYCCASENRRTRGRPHLFRHLASCRLCCNGGAAIFDGSTLCLLSHQPRE
jgi:hypothetical protein